MRFAWLRTHDGSEVPAMSSMERLAFIAYNVVWWVPPVVAFAGVVSYRTGAFWFVAITVVRALTNLYRVNVLPAEAAQRFSLRSP